MGTTTTRPTGPAEEYIQLFLEQLTDAQFLEILIGLRDLLRVLAPDLPLTRGVKGLSPRWRVASLVVRAVLEITIIKLSGDSTTSSSVT